MPFHQTCSKNENPSEYGTDFPIKLTTNDQFTTPPSLSHLCSATCTTESTQFYSMSSTFKGEDKGSPCPSSPHPKLEQLRSEVKENLASNDHPESQAKPNHTHKTIVLQSRKCIEFILKALNVIGNCWCWPSFEVGWLLVLRTTSEFFPKALLE